MQRILFAIIIFLGALLLAREPHVERVDSFFVSWLLKNTKPHGQHVPLTVVEIGRDPLLEKTPENASSNQNPIVHGTATGVTPLEFALFLQSIVDYKPTVVAFEPLIRWRESERDQEQVFLDQAMRVPKLLLATQLTATPDPDAVPTEIVGFSQVKGRRGDLPTYTGIARQPDEDLRLVSTPGYINLPAEATDATHVPLLFQYRSEVIPAFALQTFLTWARIPLGAVKIEIGSHIELPDGKKIPIRWDGSLLINPNADRLGRRFGMNELMLLAQQHPPGKNSPLDSLHDELVLARTPLNPLSPPDVFAATIATLQSNHYVHRVSVLFDVAILLLIAVLAGFAVRLARIDVLLGAIGLIAAYIIMSFVTISRRETYLPGVVPVTMILVATVIALLWPREASVIPSAAEESRSET
ncbi:MAG: hypothetical protein M3R59_07975 [Verrucomicrobiota bacterium]|nr:hypothetical protein [Verrucomicrobiota bacterium]